MKKKEEKKKKRKKTKKGTHTDLTNHWNKKIFASSVYFQTTLRVPYFEPIA